MEIFEKPVVEVETNGFGKIYSWNDIDKVRTVTLDEQRVVQFNPQDEVSVSELDARASKESEYGIVQVWKLSNADANVSGQLIVRGGNFSPVFKDDNGSIRALPGGFVIALDHQISEAEAGAKLAELGINSYQKLNFGQNLYKVPTEPGLTALEQANALHGMPGVRFATPDWWRPRVAK
jgi:hypothetical protein